MIDSDFVLGDSKEQLKLAEDFEAKKSQSASHKSFTAKVVPNTDNSIRTSFGNSYVHKA